MIRHLKIWILTSATTLVALVLLFPIYWMAMTATMPVTDILSRTPLLLPDPSKLSLDAFADVFRRRPMLLWLGNSLIVSAASTILSLIVATLAGYSLSRWPSKLQALTGAGLLVSKLIPASIIIIPLYIMFNSTGLNNSYAGLVLANMAIGVPLASWLMKNYFDRIPKEIEQAATIDGCSRISALWYVILPLSRPGLAACGVYLMIVSWSEFIFARTLISSDSKMLLNVGLQSFISEYEVQWSTLMAAGMICVVPVLLLFFIVEPLLVSGMTKGGMAN